MTKTTCSRLAGERECGPWVGVCVGPWVVATGAGGDADLPPKKEADS